MNFIMNITTNLTKLCCMAIIGLAQLQAQTIDFAALQLKGGKASSSSCVLLDDKGTVATVVEFGSDVKKASLTVGDKKVPLSYVTNDIDSRVAIYQIPAESLADVSAMSMTGVSTGLTPGDAVYTSATERGDVARVVSKVYRFQGNVLPLGVLRLSHSQAAPEVGRGIYDGDGKLIGLVRQAVFNAPQSSYCLPIEVVQRIRADHEKNGSVRRCWIGIIMDDLVAAPIVESVRPGSPADTAGLKNGDVILSIGGASVKEYAEVVDAFYYLIAGEKKVFKVLRGNEIKEFTITPEVSPGR